MIPLVLCALLAAALAVTLWLTFEILAQNGRILARLEELEVAVRAGRRAADDARGEPPRKIQRRVVLVFSDPKCASSDARPLPPERSTVGNVFQLRPRPVRAE